MDVASTQRSTHTSRMGEMDSEDTHCLNTPHTITQTVPMDSIPSSPVRKHATKPQLIVSSPPQSTMEKLQSRAQERYKGLREPMSSPLKDRSKHRMISHGQKYTLRGEEYIPFTKRERDERRSQRLLDRRGGLDTMGKFVDTQEKKRYNERLRREADAHVVQDWQVDSVVEEEKLTPYELELEMMIMNEERALEAMINDLDI